MRYPHLWARLYDAPLLLHPDKAATIERVFRSHILGGHGISMMEDDRETTEQRAEREHQRRVAAYAGIALQRRTDKPYAITQSGIALVPVMGTLVQRTMGLDALSGLQSYGEINNLVSMAAADPEVRGILLELDSPGGETGGLFDLADSISSAAATKPLWAVANEQAFSAAYAIASAADKLYLPRTALAGSVGTIALHVDQSKRDAAMGYSYTAIYAGARKNDFSSHQPLSDPALEVIRGLVNSVNDIFVAHVADRRGLTEEAVRSTEAGIFTADKAVEIGFADGIATFGETVGMIESAIGSKSNSSVVTTGARAPRQQAAAGLSLTPEKEIVMTEKVTAAAVAVLTAEQETAVTGRIEAAVKIARAEGVKEGEATGRRAERERIQGILAHTEAKDRHAQAQTLALETDMNAEQAGKVLAAAPKQAAGSPLATAMGQIQNPKVGLDSNVDGDDEDAVARRIAGIKPVSAAVTH